MSKVFTLRMLSDENDNFIRDYEVSKEMDMEEFHAFLCANLNYNTHEIASFFTSNSQWDRLREFTLMDMGDAEKDAIALMKNTKISKAINSVGDRLIYLFDMFGDRALYLEVVAVGDGRSELKYPRVARSEAAAPNQLEAGAMDGDSGSIFDEAMDEFDSFEGDDEYDDE